jgi:hypothetical protein
VLIWQALSNLWLCILARHQHTPLMAEQLDEGERLPVIEPPS